MELIKRKSGIRYRSMIWINGRNVKSPCFKRKTDCQQWLADQRSKRYEIELYGDSIKLREAMPFNVFAENWIESKIAAGLTKRSILNYQAYLRVNISPYFSIQDIKKIQKSDLEKMQRELRVKHNAKGTNNIMSIVKSILKDAHRDGYLVRNPAEYLPKLKEPPVTEMYWTRAEIDQFLISSSKHPLYDFFVVALNTGMRKGELGALQWDRVNFSLNQITVTRTRDIHEAKETTKSNLRRVVPMNTLTRAHLLKLFERRTHAPHVFTKKNEEMIDIHHVYRDFLKAQKKASITNQIPFHGLRHTFATQFMMNGGDVFTLQKILGHSDIKMTLRYAHYSTEHLQNAMNGLELGMISKEVTHILPTKEINLENVVCL